MIRYEIGNLAGILSVVQAPVLVKLAPESANANGILSAHNAVL